ncbi:hypothetical protein [Phormidium tenue]|uniref:hypothetical protein n=1 Tax=Phormidium tenue TaxID=126344 RepID=UPI0015C57907|nr:hypothetical protein [Phormidium tenue]MBD2233248.1 hypothetical protein [Phormidium tenue FACHB-1052]
MTSAAIALGFNLRDNGDKFRPILATQAPETGDRDALKPVTKQFLPKAEPLT